MTKTLKEIEALNWNDLRSFAKKEASDGSGDRTTIIKRLTEKLNLKEDEEEKPVSETLEEVNESLNEIYKQKLLPLEEYYNFHEFHSPALDNSDFTAKPMILLVGQYSTDKTTFIRYLLEQDFPGMRIGPEPTTDRFIAVMYDKNEGSIPGNALVVDSNKQFRALTKFGDAFLNRFQCSTMQNEVLNSVTIVDTPGILSGEKQRIDRGYDFTGVLEWFAERVDRIILLFDAHKLDISDEFKRCIEALSANEDKIRIVLNKSDMVDHQQLTQVRDKLIFNLGKFTNLTEPPIVFTGTFDNIQLRRALFADLQSLPRNVALRKLNELSKRARLAKVHAYIIAKLHKQVDPFFSMTKQKVIIQKLDTIFEQLQEEHGISPEDFPDVEKMRENLKNTDFTRFNAIEPPLLEMIDNMLATDIARLMAQIPKEAPGDVEDKNIKYYVYVLIHKNKFGRKAIFRFGVTDGPWKRWTHHKSNSKNGRGGYDFELNDEDHGMLVLVTCDDSDQFGIKDGHLFGRACEFVLESFCGDFNLHKDLKAGEGSTTNPRYKSFSNSSSKDYKPGLRQFVEQHLDEALSERKFVTAQDTKMIFHCGTCDVDVDFAKKTLHYASAEHLKKTGGSLKCKTCNLPFRTHGSRNAHYRTQSHKLKMAEKKRVSGQKSNSSGDKGFEVQISGLPTSITAQQLEDEFIDVGEILSASVDRSGGGIVEFAQRDDAQEFFDFYSGDYEFKSGDKASLDLKLVDSAENYAPPNKKCRKN